MSKGKAYIIIFFQSEKSNEKVALNISGDKSNSVTTEATKFDINIYSIPNSL